MRRVMIFLFLFTCLVLPVQAEDVPEAGVQALIQAEYPGCSIGKTDQRGDTAAAVVEYDGKNFLCIMERQSGQWRMAVSSSTILLPNEELPDSLYLDTDETLFWICLLYTSRCV